eukprot:3042344-Amphidinium_carterae.1
MCLGTPSSARLAQRETRTLAALFCFVIGACHPGRVPHCGRRGASMSTDTVHYSHVLCLIACSTVTVILSTCAHRGLYIHISKCPSGLATLPWCARALEASVMSLRPVPAPPNVKHAPFFFISLLLGLISWDVFPTAGSVAAAKLTDTVLYHYTVRHVLVLSCSTSSALSSACQLASGWR